MRLLHSFLRWLKGAQVYALVGESGTGKSFRAKLVANKYRIELIIDDGLVIRDDKIIAGHSAKREKTFLAAVKVAVFDDKQHRDEAAKVLQQLSRKKILILGTSEKMVNKIAMRLQIPPPQKIIRIEDIATKEEIETAKRSRRVEGKHVIPVPSTEIKRNYPQIFYDKIRLLFKNEKTVRLSEEETIFEKSVVRPEFSKTQSIKISGAALKELVLESAEPYTSIISVKKITVLNEASGYRIIMLIDVSFGQDLARMLPQLERYIVQRVEQSSGILIETINIVVDKVIDIKEGDVI
ncbi:MAG: hypothetical protein P1P65_00320 [Treponema sp.]